MFAKIVVIAACLFGFARAGALISGLGHSSGLGYGSGLDGYGSSYGGYGSHGDGYGAGLGYAGYGGYGAGLGYGGYSGLAGHGLGHATSHVSVVKSVAPSYVSSGHGYAGSALGHGYAAPVATSYANQYSVHNAPAVGYGGYGSGYGAGYGSGYGAGYGAGYGGYGAGYGGYGHGAYGHGAGW